MTMTIKRTPEPERVVKFGKVTPVENKPVETQPVVVEPVEPVPAPMVKPRLRKRKPAQ